MFFYQIFPIFFIFSKSSFGASPFVNGWSNSDCVRPWQQPQLSRATIRSPSKPIVCNPDHHTCPSGRNPVCQYSLKLHKYVCCENKKDADIPSCPKYYETLLLPCGSTIEGQCPKGYKCIGSLGDENVKLCCKPNRTLEYREPEQTFRENKIVPRLLPISPKHELIATFDGEKIQMGQLFDISVIDNLAEPPIMSAGVDLNDEKLYTIILVDSTSQSIAWLVANIAANDGQLEIHRRTKSAVSYQSPDSRDRPIGIHIMVLALFEQKEAFNQKDLAKLGIDEFTFTEWIQEFEDIIERQPLAATFYGYSTTKDTREKI